MPRRRPRALMILLSLGAFVLALGGCGRRVTSIAPEGLVGVEPTRTRRRIPPPRTGRRSTSRTTPAARCSPRRCRRPNRTGCLTSRAAGPRRLPPPAGLQTPPLPPPSSLAPPPLVPAEHNRQSVQPRLVVEETLGLGLGDPEPPQPRSFFVGDRIRLSSVDVNQPVPLPILAQPTQDRASLDDPTGDASAAAATAAAMPQRTNPVPYVRVTLPDPFANRQPLRLPVPPDDAGPRTGTVHPPTP